jgi:ring-1,2-phenylacetyl-CoA epoxidase subunit PaaD
MSAAIWAALQSVDDPEYSGVSIVDLGLVERVWSGDGRVEIDLVPTFSGCPALEMIAADVRAAVSALADDVAVRFVASPAWTPERITEPARRQLADELSIAVATPTRPARCPRCGAAALIEESMFGPVRCRSIRRCRACGDAVETIR